MQPILSIIVPIYNVQDYLSISIDSILKQTYKEFELILVDDGSDDNSGKICDEYATKDNRIVVIHQQNQGVSGARNQGVKRAKGRYIAFVDPDDEIEPNMYEVLVPQVIKHDLDIIICQIRTINYNIHSETISKVWNNVGSVIHKEKIEKSFIPDILSKGSYSILSSINKVYKKEIFKEKLFDINRKHGEDARFNLEVIQDVNRIMFVEQPLYTYYIRKRQSLTQVFRKDTYKWLKDNEKFGIKLCKKYNCDMYIPLFIDNYIIQIINYIINLINVPLSKNEKLKIINTIIDEEFYEELCKCKMPSIFYSVLKELIKLKMIRSIFIIIQFKKMIEQLRFEGIR